MKSFFVKKREFNCAKFESLNIGEYIMTRIGRIDSEFQEFKALVLKRLDDIESKLSGDVRLKEVNLNRVMNELEEPNVEEKQLPKYVDEFLKESTKKNKLITRKRNKGKAEKEDDIVLEAKNGEIIAID